MRFASRTFRRKMSKKARTRRMKQKRQRTRRSKSHRMRGGAAFPDPQNSIPEGSFSTHPMKTDVGAGMPVEPVSE